MVTHPVPTNGRTEAKLALEKGEDSKIAKYYALAQEKNAALFPLVMSSLGAFGPAFLAFLRSLQKVVPYRHLFASNPRCVKFHTYARQIISAAFAREQAKQVDRVWRQAA